MGNPYKIILPDQTMITTLLFVFSKLFVYFQQFAMFKKVINKALPADNTFIRFLLRPVF